jgi:hypothetical protein
MVSKEILLKKLKPFENNKNYLHKEQTIEDIINGIQLTHKKYLSEYDKIYKYFVGANENETAKNVFDFLKQNVPYKPESGNNQCLYSPTAILTLNKKFDCKTYSLFTNGILDAYRRNENKNFKLSYRFAGYNNDNIEHVFSVLKIDEKKNIWIDNVLPNFDNRKKPIFYFDKIIPNMALVEINGIKPKYLNNLPSYVSAGKTYESVGFVNNTINGGFFGGALGIDEKLFKEFEIVLDKMAPSLLYLYLQPISSKKYLEPYNQNSLAFFLDDATYNTLPTIVKDKVNNSFRFIWNLAGQIDQHINIKDLYGVIDRAITKKLGMSPKEFWSKFFGSVSLSGINDGVLIASTLFPSLAVPLAVFSTLVNQFMPSLRWDPPVEKIAFQLSDFNGTKFPIDKRFVVDNANGSGSGSGSGSGTGSGTGSNNKGSLLPIALGLLAAKFLLFK